MKLGYLVTVTHPDISAIYVMRKRKVKNFIKINEKTWDFHKINPREFIVKDAYLKDRELSELIQEQLPEDVL